MEEGQLWVQSGPEIQIRKSRSQSVQYGYSWPVSSQTSSYPKPSSQAPWTFSFLLKNFTKPKYGPQVFPSGVIHAVMNHSWRLLEGSVHLTGSLPHLNTLHKDRTFLLQPFLWRTYWRKNICLNSFEEKKKSLYLYDKVVKLSFPDFH